ncbi:MAG TPA: hypothetical protein VHE35_35760, partial [Kofleriaceae bacterium]|nr:hypothetical protein [Kofleriaceae bacterium]
MSAPLKILVVANPGDQAELVSLLRSAGAPLTDARIVAAVGDEGTLARFDAERPAVALVAATLERGDSPALIATMRERAAPAGIFVVLLGDVRGPVQNALDAIDYGADRFVGRPLTVKALRFAVMSGLGQGGRGWISESSPAMAVPSSPAISVQSLAAAALTSGLNDRRGMRMTPVQPVAAVTAAEAAMAAPAAEAAAPPAAEAAAPPAA